MEPHTSSFGLIDRAQDGDQEAFTLLFEKYRRRLAVLLHYRLSPELRRSTSVDDLLQETFLKAFRDIGQFTYSSPGSFMRWLVRIAGHVVIDAARYQGRQQRHAAELVRFRSESKPGGPEPADSHTPSRILAEKQAVARLLEDLNQLPEDYREAILLAKVEGLSTGEMAERMGKPREAASLLLHRAIKRFRQVRGAPGDL